MLLDRKNLSWCLAMILLGLVGSLLYLWEAARQPMGPSGSTAVGLTFGISAYALMLFAAALGLKRRVPHWRLGSAQAWMRAHIWLGLLSVLLVGFHAAFRAGGPLTTALWILLSLVVISGIAGLILQQFLPSILRSAVERESVAQQLHREFDDVQAQAREVIKTTTAAKPTGEENAAAPAVSSKPVIQFYTEYLQPYLNGKNSPLGRTAQRQSMFVGLRTEIGAPMHTTVDALERICDRYQQLIRQRWLMQLMVGWLLVHVPLSWLLLVMVAAHAIMALRY